MIENKSFNKTQTYLFITLLVLVSVIARVSNDLYMQFFSKFIEFFKIQESQVNSIIRVGFIGATLMSFFAGPLAERYGKIKVFNLSLLLYILSSSYCVFVSSFNLLLLGRFFQGISEVSIYVVGWAILLEKFSMAESGKISGMVKALSKFIFIFLPLFVLWLTYFFNWQIVFLIIPLLGIVAYIVSLITMKASAEKPSLKHKLSLSSIFLNYFSLIKNFEFFVYILIHALATSAYTVFFSNASIVYIDNGLTIEEFSILRTINTILFVIASFITIYVIGKKGLDFSKNLGFAIFYTGSLGLFVSGVFFKEHIYLAFSFAFLFSIGSAFTMGYLIKAVNIFSQMKAVCMSFYSILLSAISLRKVFWTQYLFDKSIVPTAGLILFTATVSLAFLLFLHYRKKNNDKLPN